MAEPHAQSIVASALHHILSQMEGQIQYNQLLNRIPNYLHYEFMSETYAKFDAMHKSHEQYCPKGMQEEFISDINCLIKDSLMPKGVEKESQQIDKMTMDLNESIKPRKKVLFGTRSTFKNKSLMNATHKTSNLSISSTRRRKKELNQNFISLDLNGDDDPEIANLWKKKNFQIEQREKDRKQEKERIRLFMEKKQQFGKEFAEKQLAYTFDLEGIPFSYQQNEDKIKHHALRSRFAQGERKLKQNSQLKGGSIVSDVKVKNKKSVRQDSLQGSVEFNLNIPVFDSQVGGDPGALFGIPTQVGKYRLKDYRKHYGGRYTRMQKSLNTIDVASEKNDEYNQIFSERRHFKDEESINQSMISYRSRQNSPTRRKLALPKIKGKYSTLDRYQEY